MQIVLSERKFSERIRELENIPADVTTEEITHRLDHYAKRLFEHLVSYGVSSIGLLGTSGTLGTFNVTLEACWDDTSRNARIAGLQMLDPLSVTAEQHDLRAFFTGIVLTAMYDAFPNYAHDLQRVTVGELDRKLVDIANTLFSSAPPVPQNEFEAEIQQEDFELFCLRSGVKDPLAKQRQIDAFRQGEELLYKNAQEEARGKQWGD
jgi:hypothetical protein